MANYESEASYRAFNPEVVPATAIDPPPPAYGYRPPPEYTLAFEDRSPERRPTAEREDASGGGNVAMAPRTLSPASTSTGEMETPLDAELGGEGLLDWEGAHRRLSIDNESDTSSVDQDYYAASITSSIEDQLTWRGRMQLALHSHWLHYFIVALVVLDALIVLFELLLDVGAFGNRRCEGEGLIEQAEFCHFDSESRDDCAPPAYLILEGINISSQHPGETLGLDRLCRCRFRHGKYVCRDAETSLGINPGLVLHYFSLAILSIFMIEIALKIFAFRLKYFTHKFEVFDGMVVVISWILDVASLQQEEAFEAASLLIILRLWRVVRIVNGAVLSAKTQSDNQLNEARHQARRIIHAFHKCQDKLDDAEEENEKLKQLIENHKRKRVAQKAFADSQHQPLLKDNHDDSSDEDIKGIHVSRGPQALPTPPTAEETHGHGEDPRLNIVNPLTSHVLEEGGLESIEEVPFTPHVLEQGGLESIEEEVSQV